MSRPKNLNVWKISTVSGKHLDLNMPKPRQILHYWKQSLDLCRRIRDDADDKIDFSESSGRTYKQYV
jgi:hypothetical protein